MYLVSLYFDEETERILQKYIRRTAEKTGNFYMLERQIPPHLTIAACKAKREKELMRALDGSAGLWHAGSIDWAAVGSFKPHVLFLLPVLNRYLHELCVSANTAAHTIINTIANTAADRAGRTGGAEINRYQPFGWIPHTTIARTLSEKQMLAGFHILQADFTPFTGKGVRIGLARSNPYQDIKVWELPEKGD